MADIGPTRPLGVGNDSHRQGCTHKCATAGQPRRYDPIQTRLVPMIRPWDESEVCGLVHDR